MSGYQPFETLRAIVVSGPPPMPVVDRALITDRRKTAADAREALKRLRPLHSITAKQRAWMRQERAKGVAQSVIAAAVGCSIKLVWNYTKDIPPPPGGWPARLKAKIADKQTVLDLRTKGWTYDRIAAHLGVTRFNAYDAVNGSSRGRSYAHIKTAQPARAVGQASGFRARELRAADHVRRGQPDAIRAKARHILIWLIKRDNPKVSLVQIGKKLGGLDHSSIHYGLKRVERVIADRALDVPVSAFAAARLLWSLDWKGGSA